KLKQAAEGRVIVFVPLGFFRCRPVFVVRSFPFLGVGKTQHPKHSGPAAFPSRRVPQNSRTQECRRNVSETLYDYSARNARTGSTLIARRAGMYVATPMMITMSATTDTYVTGSDGVTP